MFRNERIRTRLALGFEGLEGRALLNGAMPGPSVAAEVASSSALVIKATLAGQVLNAGNPVNYVAAGTSAQFGVVTLRGSHTATGVELGRNRGSRDTYTNGVATLSASAGSFDANYTGKGTTNARGIYNATLRGTVIGASGQALGHDGTFSAKIRGSSVTGAFTVTVTIRA